MFERVFELVTAAADVFFAGVEVKLVIRLDRIAGLAGGLGVHADLPGEDGAFGALAAFAKAAFHQCLVEANHGCFVPQAIIGGSRRPGLIDRKFKA